MSRPPTTAADPARRRPEPRPCLTGSRAAPTRPRAHDSARRHVTGEALYIDDLPEPAGLLHVQLGLSDQGARADHAASTSSRCAPPPGVVLRADRRRRPGRERRQPDPPPRRAAARDRPRRVRRPADLRRRRRAPATRRGAPPGSPWSNTRSCRPILDAEAALPTGVLVTDPLTLRRGDAKAAIAAAPRRLSGPDAHRRAGALLSRGPDRAGRAGRGRRGHGLLLDPAPDRDPAHGGEGAGRALARRDGRDPPHGRRLRRQGDPGQPVRLPVAPSSRRRPAAPPRPGPIATTTWWSPASATTSSSTTRSASTTRAASTAST